MNYQRAVHRWVTSRWLIIKPEREKAATEVFRDTAINVTIEGHKHLGAAVGSRSFLEEYVDEKVDE